MTEITKTVIEAINSIDVEYDRITVHSPTQKEKIEIIRLISNGDQRDPNITSGTIIMYDGNAYVRSKK